MAIEYSTIPVYELLIPGEDVQGQGLLTLLDEVNYLLHTHVRHGQMGLIMVMDSQAIRHP
ncbi:hypothetical protein EON63_25355 [archaeon]|nr:MAG: hypothetical protein EON63_25355 [archaeon]